MKLAQLINKAVNDKYLSLEHEKDLNRLAFVLEENNIDSISDLVVALATKQIAPSIKDKS